MQNGDLSNWNGQRTLIVLEGVIVTIPPPHKKGILRTHKEIPPQDQWEWNTHTMKVINDQANRYNRLFEVVTFVSQEVADEAADVFDKYEVRVAETMFSPFNVFCESLLWRTDIDKVVDSDEDRLNRFGRYGYGVVQGQGLF